MNIFARCRVSMIKTVSGRAVQMMPMPMTTTPHDRHSMTAEAHYQMSQTLGRSVDEREIYD